MASATDSWLIEYETCEKFCRDILESIHKRDKQQRNGDGYAKLNAAIRQNLKKFNDDLKILHENLIRSSRSPSITQMEADRRQRLLDNLKSKQTYLQDIFSRKDNSFNTERNALLGQTFSNLPQTNWNAEETDETRDLSIDDIRLQQRQVLEAQDRGLEALSDIIVRQKHVANAISNEVEIQNGKSKFENEIIDDITDHVDNTRDRLIRETRHVKIVHKKSGTCSLWVLIILLLIAIVVVVAIPKPS